MSKELDARLAALIERCDETDRLIIDTRRFADLEDENAKLREQGERLFDKTLELATENVRLQDENARLRSCLSDDAENARMIMAENEKLRELCRSMYHELMKRPLPPEWITEYGSDVLEYYGIEVDG